MAIIANLSVGANETKRVRILNGSITTITKAEFEACLGSTLKTFASNALGEQTGFGDAFEACNDYPGGIHVRVSGSAISRQPLPLNYSISSITGDRILVIGTVTVVDGGDGGGGGDSESPPSDPNFGGEPPIDLPDIADPPGSPPALPSGNGNKGFTTSTGGGSETGITGGNA